MLDGYRNEEYARAMVAAVMPISPEDERRAAERRERLLAALKAQELSQADLLRKLYEAGEKTSPSTVSNWCRGAAALTEVQVRGLLSLIGLDADWRPSTELVRRALDEQESRARIPRDKRKPSKATKR